MLSGGLGPSAPTPGAAEVEAKLPAFEILSVLGQGGMGVVFKARQKALDRVVALKVLPSTAAAQAGFAERFAREAKALARLQHPNIVAVHDFGEAVDEKGGGLFWLVMEFVDGANLRQAMRAGEVKPKDALAIVPQICDALQYAHEHGVVHRDIKPENVLLDATGRVKVADFGLAKLMERDADGAALTRADQVMGTPHYMAPEQVEHPADVDHRADIYSLGVVFYEMLTGELPLGRFPAPSVKSGIDARIDEIVLRTLEKERAARYQQAAQVKTDVGKAATGKPRREFAPPKRWREYLPLSPQDQAKQDRLREGLVGGFLLLVGLNAWLAFRRSPVLVTLPSLALVLIAVATFWRLRAWPDAETAAAAWRRRRITAYGFVAVVVMVGVAWTFVAPTSADVRWQSAALSFWALVFLSGLVRRWNMTVLIVGLLLIGTLSAIAMELVTSDRVRSRLSSAAAARLSADDFRAQAGKDGPAIDLADEERAQIDALWRAWRRLPASPTLDDVAGLYSDETMTKLRAMTTEERAKQAAEGNCGVPLLPRSVLPRPPSDFHLDTVGFDIVRAGVNPDRAIASASADGVEIRFFFERLPVSGPPDRPTYGPWFFSTWASVGK
jgi:serine/threonine protein kinase